MQDYFTPEFIASVLILIYLTEFKIHSSSSEDQILEYFLIESNTILNKKYYKTSNDITSPRFNYNSIDFANCAAYALLRFDKLHDSVRKIINSNDKLINTAGISPSNCIEFIKMLMKQSKNDNKIIWYGGNITTTQDWDNIKDFMNKPGTKNNSIEPSSMIVDIDNQLTYKLDKIKLNKINWDFSSSNSSTPSATPSSNSRLKSNLKTIQDFGYIIHYY